MDTTRNKHDDLLANIAPLGIGDYPTSAPLLIAGPCSAESEEQVLTTAHSLADMGIKVFRAGIWKPRTKPGGFEGVGERGLEWLRRVKAETGMAVATEVATRSHVMAALEADVDLFWIGARTAANPFAVQEVADALEEAGADVAVLVKNPVNADLDLWIGALERINNAGIRRLGAIHRGFSAYGNHIYRNEPQWRIPIELRRRYPQLPIVCDPSHIGGKRELIAPLSQQAVDMGFDGLIIESHCNPDCALSDSRQQLTPAELQRVLEGLTLRADNTPTEELDCMRYEIDRLDNELIDILAKRMEVSREIGRYKKEHGMKIVQPRRYDSLLTSRLSQGSDSALGEDFVRSVFAAIHEESVRQQIDIFKTPKSNGSVS